MGSTELHSRGVTCTRSKPVSLKVQPHRAQMMSTRAAGDARPSLGRENSSERCCLGADSVTSLLMPRTRTVTQFLPHVPACTRTVPILEAARYAPWDRVGVLKPCLQSEQPWGFISPKQELGCWGGR